MPRRQSIDCERDCEICIKILENLDSFEYQTKNELVKQLAKNLEVSESAIHRHFGIHLIKQNKIEKIQSKNGTAQFKKIPKPYKILKRIDSYFEQQNNVKTETILEFKVNKKEAEYKVNFKDVDDPIDPKTIKVFLSKDENDYQDITPKQLRDQKPSKFFSIFVNLPSGKCKLKKTNIHTRTKTVLYKPKDEVEKAIIRLYLLKHQEIPPTFFFSITGKTTPFIDKHGFWELELDSIDTDVHKINWK